MLILHDSAISKSKLLIPVPKREWLPSSQSLPKDQFGNETRNMFGIRARSNDGKVVWMAHFEDREDFDAFLWALVNKTLKYERALWDLPTPTWQPYLGELISYEFYGTSFLTTAGSIQTYNVPIDWTMNNKIYCIGGGGGGGQSVLIYYYSTTSINTAEAGSGGGGGGYSMKKGVSLTPGGTCQYFVAAGGNPSPSTNTWFNGTTGTNCCVASSGLRGWNNYEALGRPAAGIVQPILWYAQGGTTANGIGDIKYAGGSSSSMVFNNWQNGSNWYACGSGGGGAAGPYGNGADGYRAETPSQIYIQYGRGGGGADGGSPGGTTPTSQPNVMNGGANRLGTGFGTASQNNATNGGGGSGNDSSVNSLFDGNPGSMETTASFWSTSFGCGGGGGSGSSQNRAKGGNGGLYGGGGGGSSLYAGTRDNRISTGAQGLIVVEWKPMLAGFNSPMLGM